MSFAFAFALTRRSISVDDVFLWNFLSESRASKEWRVVLSYLTMRDAGVEQDLEAKRSALKDKELSGMLRPLEFRCCYACLSCAVLSHSITL